MRWHSELSFGTMEALALRSACAIAAACSEDWLRRSPCASAMLKQGKRLGMALGLTGAVASPRQRRCKSRPWPNLFGNGRNAARFRCNQSSSKVGFAEAPPSRPCPSKGNGLTWHSTQSGLWLCARLALSLLLCSEDWLRRSPCASVMLKQGKRLGMALGLTGAVASPRQRRCKSRPWPNLFGNGRNAARFRCNQSSSKVGFAEAPPSRPCPSKGNGLTWHSTQSGLWLCARLALSLHRFWANATENVSSIGST